MALIKPSNAGDISKQTIVLDLGDLQRQAATLVQRGKTVAEKLVADAHEERKRVVAGAAETGYAEGFEKGFNQGRIDGAKQAMTAALDGSKKQFEELAAGWLSALKTFVEEREELVQRAEREVVALAVAIGERVTKRAIAHDPRVVVEQLRAVLEVVVRPMRLVIAINPADRPLIEQSLAPMLALFPAVRHAEIVDDPSLGRGSCVAWTRGEEGNPNDAGGGEIDASIATQLDRIAEVLLPGRTDGETSH